MRTLEIIIKQKFITFIWNVKRTLFFTVAFSKCVCLIFHYIITVYIKGNVEQHFHTVHKKYYADFPPKRELKKREVKELKSQLSGQQSLFLQHTSK